MGGSGESQAQTCGQEIAMAGGENYRGQCNLHLFLASQHLSELRSGDAAAWGGHYRRAQGEAVILQLQLAYQAHLADLIKQQPQYKQSIPAGCFSAASLLADQTMGQLPPEFNELAERERLPGWLFDIVAFEFLLSPSTQGAGVASHNPAVIASQSSATPKPAEDAAHLQFLQTELSELINRQRGTAQEY